jgi:uncharacterized protein (DUF1501 family)
MNRRQFMFRAAAGAAWWALSPQVSVLAAPGGNYRRLLVLVELKGGNDGLNTLVPFADPAYFALRPNIAIARDTVLPLSEQVGLHPSLAALMPLWQTGELAVLQGVGYPAPNLSHFRSIEIWNTASASHEVRQQGWLSRAFDLTPPPREFFADGLRVGQGDMGPLAGGGTRSIALSSVDQFLNQSRLAQSGGASARGALAHIMRVDQDILTASQRLHTEHAPQPAAGLAEIPKGPFGEALKTTAHVLDSGAGVAAVCVGLNGFDTHQNQPGVQGNLLRQLGEGLSALKSVLEARGRWRDTLVLTYAEFGRRARENSSRGTDHGTASVHFACGGAVRGGLYGGMPSLTALDGSGNLNHTLDFRAVYATVLQRWWGLASEPVLGARFRALDFLPAA